MTDANSRYRIAGGCLTRDGRTWPPAETAGSRFPRHLIETINKVVRTSRQMLNEIGRGPNRLATRKLWI